MNMIEIEVEMEIELPEAELVGIEQQMMRLEELEGLQDDWRLQAEARDEVSLPSLCFCLSGLHHHSCRTPLQVERLLKAAS